MKNPKLIVIMAILLIVVLGGGFYTGIKYQQNQRGHGSQFGQMTQRMGQTRLPDGQDFRPMTGEIIGQDDESITVKLQDGSSKIILLTDTTAINKFTEGSKSDLKTGERVAVFGTENSDGSVTGQNIQLNRQ